jgi:hypothetical protein
MAMTSKRAILDTWGIDLDAEYWPTDAQRAALRQWAEDVRDRYRATREAAQGPATLDMTDPYRFGVIIDEDGEVVCETFHYSYSDDGPSADYTVSDAPYGIGGTMADGAMWRYKHETGKRSAHWYASDLFDWHTFKTVRQVRDCNGELIDL